MKLESSFSVRAPIDEVWAALLDVERVAPCVPGAHVLERRHEDVYELRLDLELGAAPVVSCSGQVAIVEQRAEDRRAVLNLTAESDGNARAVALLELSLVADGDLTAGSVAGELSLTGAAAAVDQGEIRAAVERLVDSFARNLAALLGGGVPTVNGADPASSSAGTPAPLGDPMPTMRSILDAPGGSAGPDPEEDEPPTGAAEAAADEPDQPDEPGPPGDPSSADGSWAGATRQAGATIERLRSPLGAVLLGLVIVAALIGGLRRARRRAAAAAAARSVGSAG